MMRIPPQIEQVYAKRREDNAERKEQIRLKLEKEYPDLALLKSAYTEAGLNLILAKINNSATAIEEAERLLQDSDELLQKRYADLEKTLYPSAMFYHCELCQDTGNDKGQLCSCALDIVEHLEKRSGVAFPPPKGIKLDNFDESLFVEEVSDQWYGGRVSPKLVAQNFLRKAKELIAAFPVAEKGMYFFGKPGTGKTWLAAAIANALREKGFSTAFIRAMDYVDLSSRWRVLERSFYADEVELQTTREKLRFLDQADILVLDDLGSEVSNDMAYNDIIRLIDQRLDGEHKLSIITGNLSPADFSKRYDERMGSRLTGSFTLFPIDGPDLRLVIARAKRS